MKFYGFLLFVVVVSGFVSCKDESEKGYKAQNIKESCLNCHQNMSGFSEYHNPQQIGCASCHLGNTTTDDQEKAHQGMVLLPGNFSNVTQTCATANCHATEWSRMEKAMMTTNSGIVSVDKLLFEEIHHTDSLFHIAKIGTSAADTHLENLCANCHLGKEKKHYAVTDELSRGGGCIACHVNYHEGTIPNIKDNVHPTIDLSVGSNKCFGCHSRSGRITLNYEGWYELDYTADPKAVSIRNRWEKLTNFNRKLISLSEIKKLNTENTAYRLLQDGRVLGKAPADDAHHQAGLECIDCHLSQEVMGDGKSYKHQHEALKISCEDCHRPQKNFKGKLDAPAIKDYALRRYKHPLESVLYTQKDSVAIVNAFFDKKDKVFLTTKNSKKTIEINTNCKRDAVHNDVSCSMCHTAWAPTCVGCHTQYDASYIWSDGTKGRWKEHISDFSATPPTIAVRKKGNQKQFVPAVPGMVMSLDQSDFKGNKKGGNLKFIRWYAPNAAHTTVKKARDCKSCHNNPQALGYGKGELKLNIQNNKAKWEFTPYYDKTPQDHLPQDAWIDFLKDLKSNQQYAAHNNFNPLNLKDQKTMLQVGSCLTCHTDATFQKRMVSGEYQSMLSNKTNKCVVPQ